MPSKVVMIKKDPNAGRPAPRPGVLLGALDVSLTASSKRTRSIRPANRVKVKKI